MRRKVTVENKTRIKGSRAGKDRVLIFRLRHEYKRGGVDATGAEFGPGGGDQLSYWGGE
jgi:hypothetical protein